MTKATGVRAKVIMKTVIHKIMEQVDGFLNLIRPYIAPDNDFRYIKLGLLGLIIVAFFMLFYYLRKSNVIKNTIRDNYERTIVHMMNNKSRNNGDFALLRRMREKYMYSGIEKKITFMTPDIWFAFIIILFSVVLVVAIVASSNIVTGLIFAVASVSIVLFIENILAYNNYRRVDKCLLEFLNMLGNYSSQNSEITEIFSYIYNKVDEPLSFALKECVFEAESVGTETALLNLSNKIEHPKFKEIIQNIRIAVKHSTTFRGVVENNNSLIGEYIKLKKEAKQKAIGNFLQFLVCFAMGIFILIFTGYIVETDIVTYIKENTMSQLELFVSILCLIYAGWQIYKISK